MNLFGAREVVLNTIAKAATARIVVLAAAVLGPLGPEQNEAVLFLVLTGLSLLLSYVEAVVTRKRVTPVVDPRTDGGERLIPASEVDPTNYRPLH